MKGGGQEMAPIMLMLIMMMTSLKTASLKMVGINIIAGPPPLMS